jgi:nucleoside-diphosphate-sugar epimerase
MLFRVLFSKAHGESFNIGNPEIELSVNGLAQYVADAMPYPVKIVYIDPPHAVYSKSDPKRRCPDISKIKKVTGFRPKYPLEEGLRRTITWFSET